MYSFPRRSCESSGEFSDHVPECKARSCGEHSIIPEGIVSSAEEQFFGMVVLIDCEQGYDLVGDSKRWVKEFSFC